jgi:transcription elongation factor Elf1
MAQNPLQKYFRQPKIFISLPSKGVYNTPGVIQGDASNLPVYGMTGMDEIIMKTPDALLTGDSVVKVIESCCPSIKDAWQLSNLDTDLVLAAIRIATFGNTMGVIHTCPKCGHENSYDIELAQIIDHFSRCEYESKVVVNDLIVKLQPLNYKQVSDFALKNYAMQKTLQQSGSIEDELERQQVIADLYKQLGVLRNEIFAAGIDSIDIPGSSVSERVYIIEWLDNADKSTFDAIKKVIDRNNETWKTPAMPVKCEECESENLLRVELDQASFFDNA